MENIEKQIEDFEVKLLRKGYDGLFDNWRVNPGPLAQVIHDIGLKVLQQDKNLPVWIATGTASPNENGDYTKVFFSVKHDVKKGFSIPDMQIITFDRHHKDIGTWRSKLNSFKQLPSRTQANEHVGAVSVIPTTVFKEIETLEKVLKEKNLDFKFLDMSHGSLHEAIEKKGLRANTRNCVFPGTYACDFENRSIQDAIQNYMFLCVDVSARGKLITPYAEIIREDGNSVEPRVVSKLLLNNARELPEREVLRKAFPKHKIPVNTTKKQFKL